MESTIQGGSVTVGEAVRDATTTLGRQAAETRSERERVIGEWVALGYTREEAWNAALFGWRK